MNNRLLLEIRRSLRWFVIFGAFCTLGGIGAYVVFKNLTYNRPWGDYRTLKIAADDVNGIVPGKHQVRVHGVKVGIVDKAEVENGQAILTLRVEKKHGLIYRDARMQVRPVTPLQDLYVNVLDRGTPKAGVADESSPIPAQRTVTPVQIAKVLDTFDADTRQRLTVLLTELNPAMRDGGKKLREAFAAIAPFLTVAQDATRVLAKRERNVRAIVTRFGDVAQALAKRDTQVAELVSRGNATLGELAANDRPLGATIDRIPPTLDAMRSSFVTLRKLSGALDPALHSLGPVADRLDSGLAGLEDFGRQAKPALRALRPALADLRPMARTLSPTSRSLQTAFERLNVEAPQFDHLTRDLVPCLAMAQDFFHHTLSVFKFQDALGAFPRAEMTVDLEGFNGGTDGLNTRRMPTCVKER